MAGWLARLVGGGRDPRLPRLLAGYPRYHQPYPGPGRALERVQAEANLAYLLEQRDARLAILRDLLVEFAIDLDVGLGATDPKPFLLRLGDWTATEWPSIRDEALMPIEVWLDSRRDGKGIVFSLIMDVGILLGEILLRRRDDYRWALDLDPSSEQDEMVSWQRPVVLRPADDGVRELRFDVEEMARTAYVQCGKPGYNVRRDFGRGVLDAISGAHETWWRQQAESRHG